MKKFVFPLLLLLGSVSLTAQQPLFRKYHDLTPAGSLADKIRLIPNPANLKSASQVDFPKRIGWSDWIGGAWVEKAVQTNEYNASGYRLTEVIDSLAGTDVRYVYTYDGQNRLLDVTLQTMVAGGWGNQSRTRYEYDLKGARSLWMWESWTNGAWLPTGGARYDREYSGDLVFKETTLLWNSSSGQYLNFWRFTYTYENGVLKSGLNETYRNGAWVPYFRETLYWLTGDMYDYILYDQWTGTAWMPDARESYRYYGEMNVEVTENYWSAAAGAYVPQDRFVEEYDAHQNFILSTSEQMKQGAWTLTQGERYTMAYEGDHATSRISELCATDSVGNFTPWTKTTRELYSDFFNLGTDPILAEQLSLTIIPNPVRDQALVKITLPRAGNFRLTLYTLTGSEVLDETVYSNGTEIRYQLNASQIPAGSYLLVASDPKGTELGKTRLIKQ